METNDTTFEKLLKVNVSDKVKAKGTGKQAQNYLSWNFAWEKIKKECPDANYKVLRADNGVPYFADDFGIMIMTEVTIGEETLSMWLPVLDGANRALKRESYTYKAIKWEGTYPNKRKNGFEDKTVNAATMFDINTATMRCLVKNFAMFGLGLNLYTGEDFVEKITINTAQNSEIMKLIQDNNLDLLEFCTTYGMQKPMELHSTNFNDAIELLEGAINAKQSIAEFSKAK